LYSRRLKRRSARAVIGVARGASASPCPTRGVNSGRLGSPPLQAAAIAATESVEATAREARDFGATRFIRLLLVEASTRSYRAIRRTRSLATLELALRGNRARTGPARVARVVPSPDARQKRGA